MRLQSRSFAYSVLLVLPLSGLAAVDARPIVGTALSSAGTFQVGHTPASGTATILSGDLVETAGSSSKIMLKSGSELELLPHSATSVFAGHAALDSGTLKTKLSGTFYVSARNFTVQPASPMTEAIVQTASAGSITVSVASGGVDVLGAGGGRIVHVVAGSTLNLDAYATASPNENVARVLGVLDSENGHFLVRDRFTNTVSELVGPVSPKLLNHLVMVDGNVLTNDKSSVVQVDRLVKVSRIALSDATTAIPCQADGTGGIAAIIRLAGALTKVREHFLLQDRARAKTFELVGDVDDKEIGTEIRVRGFILPKRQALLPAEQVVYTESRKFALFASPCAGAIIGTTLVSTGFLLSPGNDQPPTRTPISF